MKTTINLVKPVMITPPTSLMKTWTITLACLFGAFGSAVNASTIINESFDSWPVTDWVASHSAGVASASVSGENRLNIFRAAVDGVGKSIELASISYSNAVEEAGYFGLRSVYPNSGLNTYYNDLSLTVIPEWNAPAI